MARPNARESQREVEVETKLAAVRLNGRQRRQAKQAARQQAETAEHPHKDLLGRLAKLGKSYAEKADPTYWRFEDQQRCVPYRAWTVILRQAYVALRDGNVRLACGLLDDFARRDNFAHALYQDLKALAVKTPRN